MTTIFANLMGLSSAASSQEAEGRLTDSEAGAGPMQEVDESQGLPAPVVQEVEGGVVVEQVQDQDTDDELRVEEDGTDKKRERDPVTGQLINKKRAIKPICKHEGCTTFANRWGYCGKHGGNYQCKVEGCKKNAKESGLCKAHGGGVKICKIDTCGAHAVRWGLCENHGGYEQCRFQDCQSVPKRNGYCMEHGGNPRTICTFDGCSTLAIKNGLCGKHGGSARCKAEGCTMVAQGKGYCRKHGGGVVACSEIVDGVRCTTRAQRNGKCSRHGGVYKCQADGCDKKAQLKGYCRVHGKTAGVI